MKISKSHCSRGETCSFKHEDAKKGKIKVLVKETGNAKTSHKPRVIERPIQDFVGGLQMETRPARKKGKSLR